MALADTSKAIGAVSSLLKERIDAVSSLPVSIGRPADVTDNTPSLNLFLYEIHFDEHLKNTPLNDGEKPPLWLVLKYLLTAFHSSNDSDSEDAHLHLGAALRAVCTDDLLRLDPTFALVNALDPNPSPLHVTFDDSPSDLAAKLMQGPDDKIRLSACFQVRPVMIAAAEPGDYSLLVGIDYTQTPPVVVAEDPLKEPVGIDVTASLGPRLAKISPIGFEVNDIEPEEVSIRGTDLHLANLSVFLGPVELPIVSQKPDELKFSIDPATIRASGISAGSHPVTVVQTLPANGRKRKSNAVIGNLVPTVNTAVASGIVVTNHPPGPPDNPDTVHATIDLTGNLLGADTDDTILAFYKDGTVNKMFDVFTAVGSPVPPGQPDRQLVMTVADDVPTGEYNMILIVNGQQAPQSPKILLT